jgi:hypothetical protein
MGTMPELTWGGGGGLLKKYIYVERNDIEKILWAS